LALSLCVLAFGTADARGKVKSLPLINADDTDRKKQEQNQNLYRGSTLMTLIGKSKAVNHKGHEGTQREIGKPNPHH
jgi:hypothetical protein